MLREKYYKSLETSRNLQKKKFVVIDKHQFKNTKLASRYLELKEQAEQGIIKDLKAVLKVKLMPEFIDDFGFKHEPIYDTIDFQYKREGAVINEVWTSYISPYRKFCRRLYLYWHRNEKYLLNYFGSNGRGK